MAIIHIIDSKLKQKVKDSFPSRKTKIELKDINKIFNIITEINNENKIFIEVSEQLNILGYNLLYIQIYNMFKYINIECDYNGIVLIIKNCLHHACNIISAIKMGSGILNKHKKEAFYDLIRDNQLIIIEVYKLRRKFYDYSINKLCNNEGVPELSNEITSQCAMIKLFELTESDDYSRLQRALDILIKYGDILIITDKYGLTRSNASKLGLTRDDMYSLQLLTRLDRSYISNLYEFLKESVYNIIGVFGLKFDEVTLYNLYTKIFNMSKQVAIKEVEYIKYINDSANEIKMYVKELKAMEGIGKLNIFKSTEIYNAICHDEEFDYNSSKNTLVNRYLKSIKCSTSIIKSKEPKYKLNIHLIVFITMCTLMVVIYLAVTKRTVNN
ncbi:hypothetical protein NEPAR06_0480 [Nematocida parisii]|uniref:Uncharacterized protein n=1 Tax=Nematocida parisii (strain ERTm3) TaxID=935791 RepID=I3EJH6_NEMP3|nr:uncharacterized protein NEPG_01096 [Nematocida parisii ERTm1]EIJ89373.1 hypothetical protein NEQG_00143 [Nematocida parisii ERTm3]KAI5142602.1 hypothetical protein NEPAR07_0207 [Nematocida parisii]EIJ94428.1 hypothetical protein NEPG_01096 [Nematocida parisii ERTm1]KAI5153480.1 hypothetical protein NEPAR06_0480 [Nematocida parisii]KAI5156903.1 hypothetical protein NEPAR05_0886 [Nematocida parisii]|eukprot:XP_013058924.1 hypothetical protein NEPG_01096 [Nematocida parisii ERTm1]